MSFSSVYLNSGPEHRDRVRIQLGMVRLSNPFLSCRPDHPKPVFPSRATQSPILSAVTQNQPLKVEIKGVKTSHFLEQKTAPQDHADAGPMGHVERPQSESASNDLQFTRQRLVPAADRPRAWDRSRDRWAVFAVGKTSHFDHRG